MHTNSTLNTRLNSLYINDFMEVRDFSADIFQSLVSYINFLVLFFFSRLRLQSDTLIHASRIILDKLYT